MESNSKDDFKKLKCPGYGVSLHDSIETVFQSLNADEEDIKDLHETFFRFIDYRIDPPLEAIWIHAALTFEGNPMHEMDFDERINYVKHQFEAVCERSVSSGVSKSIAMLAPVCLWISGLFVFAYTSGFDSVTHNAMVRKIRALVDLILGYVSVSCCNSSDDGSSHRLYKPLGDLLSLWMAHKSSSNVLTCTFSSLSDEQKLRLSRDGCEVSELAAAVAAQLFLMRMGLSIEIAGENSDLKTLQKEIKRWGIATLTGLRSRGLFVMLLQLLLEPEPVTSTLSSEAGAMLRTVLYDVMLVDYTYLEPESVDDSSSVYLKDIALMRLAVAFEAVEFFRENGDLSKAISCENAFSTSRLSAQIVKLVPSGVVLNKVKRTGSSPSALLKWFLELEQQGVRVFSDSTAKFSDKLSLKLSKQGRDKLVQDQVNGEDSDEDDNNIMFSIDKVGDMETENEEETEKMSNAFVSAAHTMNTVKTSKSSKRKGGLSGKLKKKQKKSITENDLSDSSEGENKSSTSEDSD